MGFVLFWFGELVVDGVFGGAKGNGASKIIDWVGVAFAEGGMVRGFRCICLAAMICIMSSSHESLFLDGVEVCV